MDLKNEGRHIIVKNRLVLKLTLIENTEGASMPYLYLCYSEIIYLIQLFIYF